MMVAPATALGIDLLLFAQSPDDSGAQITHHVVGDYTDLEALTKFAATCDVVTFEHELVPLSVIRGLEASGVKVYPPSSAFIYSQDKAQMRQKLSAYPSPAWKIATTTADIERYPLIAKAISGGYDGRG
ncbi:MAG: 5-(carboxyamino)imidazole ribonucleotide synthase, partial [Chloroflexi bacterium]|nr:5-(carboxyamino)imidazole ribonucleotide synthase [Chloroflexota bacterium]